jgi:hypothetical protein
MGRHHTRPQAQVTWLQSQSPEFLRCQDHGGFALFWPKLMAEFHAKWPPVLTAAEVQGAVDTQAAMAARYASDLKVSQVYSERCR